MTDSRPDYKSGLKTSSQNSIFFSFAHIPTNLLQFNFPKTIVIVASLSPGLTPHGQSHNYLALLLIILQ